MHESAESVASLRKTDITAFNHVKKIEFYYSCAPVHMHIAIHCSTLIQVHIITEPFVMVILSSQNDPVQ